MSKTILNLLLITVSVALCYLVIWPVYFGGGSLFVVPADKSIVQLREAQNKNQVAMNQVDDGLRKISNLQDAYKTIGQDEEAQKRLDVMLPSSVDPMRLISEVTKVTKDLGLSVDSISYTKEAEDKQFPNIGIYSVSFSAKTSYLGVRNMINKFETSMRLFSIQSISFGAGATEKDPMTVSVKMNTYYIK